MKVLRKYLQKRNKAITGILELPASSYTTESRHVLRVEIKKLNAMLDLVKGCDKDFKKKQVLKPFREIFRQAGRVREIEIEIAILENNHTNDHTVEFKAGLYQSLAEETQAFFSLVDKKMIRRIKKRGKDIDRRVRKIRKKQAKKYLDSKIAHIKDLVHKDSMQPDALHEIRKQIKIIQYNISSLGLEDRYQPIIQDDDLPGLLGKWHDLQVMTEHLEEVIASGAVQNRELLQLKDLSEKLTGECEEMLKVIQKALAASAYSDKQISYLG